MIRKIRKKREFYPNKCRLHAIWQKRAPEETPVDAFWSTLKASEGKCLFLPDAAPQKLNIRINFTGNCHV